MHTCTDMVSTNHVIPQEGKDTLFCSIGVGIKIEIGRRHGKLHIVDIKSTHDLPKVLITCLLLKLKVALLHVPHTPHRTKTDGEFFILSRNVAYLDTLTTSELVMFFLLNGFSRLANFHHSKNLFPQ